MDTVFRLRLVGLSFFKNQYSQKNKLFPFSISSNDLEAEKFFLGHENVKVQYFSIAMVYIDIWQYRYSIYVFYHSNKFFS